MPVLVLVKTFCYWLVFRLRSKDVAGGTCLLIAASPLVLALIPFPLPSFLTLVLGIALTVAVMTKYAGVRLFPDSLIISGSVEIVVWTIFWLVAG
jgi:hypothetical protein